MLNTIFQKVHQNTEDVIYGYHIRKEVAETLESEQRNVAYQELVWGQSDNADNDQLLADEHEVIASVLGTSSSHRVLEVGCGSGRLTAEIARRVESLVALDQTETICARAALTLGKQGVKNCEILCADFANLSGFNQKFSHIFLLENMIGMNLLPKRRMAIFQTAANLLQPGGVAVFGFRVVSYVPEGKIWYQAMPWRTSSSSAQFTQIQSMFGVAANWSVGGFLQQLKAAQSPLVVKKIFSGEKRPAGGKSYFAILERSELCG